MIADLALDGLAAYRLTRLMRQDTITEPARDWIEARSVAVRHVCVEGCGPNRHFANYESKVVDVQPYAFLRDGLDCPWCASVWAAGIVLALHWIPGGRLLRDVLAVAAVAGVANYVDDHLTGVVHDVEHDEDIGTAQTGGDE